MRRISMMVMAALGLAGCGPEGFPEMEALTGLQPQVISVTPGDGAHVAADAVVELVFSRPIDPASLNRTSLAVLRLDEGAAPREEIAADVADGDVEISEGLYVARDDGRAIGFLAAAPYEAGATYLVVATGRILSAEGLPLNQQPGLSPAPFVSSFVVEGGEGSASSDEGAEAGNSGGEGDDAEPQRHRPASLVINELLYDIVGSDTNGSGFIELAGDAGGDITGYKVLFINGADGETTGSIEMTEGSIIPADGVWLIADARDGESGATNVVGADLVDNFDPQNGPDCVQLVDDAGQVLDALGYGTPIVALAANGKSCYEEAPAPKTPSGQSLLRTAGVDTQDNVADFAVAVQPTPGTL